MARVVCFMFRFNLNTYQHRLGALYMFPNPGACFCLRSPKRRKQLRHSHGVVGGGGSAHAIQSHPADIQTPYTKASDKYTEILQVYSIQNTSPDAQIQVQTPKYKSRPPKYKSRRPNTSPDARTAMHMYYFSVLLRRLIIMLYWAKSAECRALPSYSRVRGCGYGCGCGFQGRESVGFSQCQPWIGPEEFEPVSPTVQWLRASAEFPQGLALVLRLGVRLVRVPIAGCWGQLWGLALELALELAFENAYIYIYIYVHARSSISVSLVVCSCVQNEGYVLYRLCLNGSYSTC